MKMDIKRATYNKRYPSGGQDSMRDRDYNDQTKTLETY